MAEAGGGGSSKAGDSVVLEELIDESYEPTQREVLEYAKWLGMDLVRRRRAAAFLLSPPGSRRLRGLLETRARNNSSSPIYPNYRNGRRRRPRTSCCGSRARA